MLPVAFMYVCMYVCLHVCIDVCIGVYVYVRFHVCENIPTDAYIACRSVLIDAATALCSLGRGARVPGRRVRARGRQLHRLPAGPRPDGQ